jgi:aminocarboxymuconate-semialdehyde decarboxylase
MIVDAHVHAIPPSVTRSAEPADTWRPAVTWEGGSQVVEFGGREIRSAVREFVRIDRILEQEASRGIDHVVLSPWVLLLPYRLPLDEAIRVCRIQNEAFAEMAEAHPGKVSALGAVPAQDSDASVDELQKLMGLPGLRGVEVAASVNGVYLGDDRFASLWEAAEATGAVVFVHPTTGGFDLPVFQEHYLWNTVANPMETAATAAHMVMAGVLERFPSLRVILAHGGGALMAVRGRLRHAHGFQPQARARLEGSPDAGLRRLFYDSLTHDLGLLRDLVQYAGADHVLLGSDHPFDMGTDRPVEDVRTLGLPAFDEEAILGGTATRVLGLPT